jgi:hypothetical protein
MLPESTAAFKRVVVAFVLLGVCPGELDVLTTTSFA